MSSTNKVDWASVRQNFPVLAKQLVRPGFGPEGRWKLASHVSGWDSRLSNSVPDGTVE
ncbi:MAG: hypothetical protein ACK45B_06495 [Limisphaerales bacterium]